MLYLNQSSFITNTLSITNSGKLSAKKFSMFLLSDWRLSANEYQWKGAKKKQKRNAAVRVIIKSPYPVDSAAVTQMFPVTTAKIDGTWQTKKKKTKLRLAQCTDPLSKFQLVWGLTSTATYTANAIGLEVAIRRPGQHVAPPPADGA